MIKPASQENTWALTRISPALKGHLTRKSATALVDIARVTLIYLGSDTHFRDGIPRYMSCPFLSNSSVAGASVSGGWVVLLCVFGLALFDVCNSLLSVMDVGGFVSVILSTVLCTCVANTRHGSVGEDFRPARLRHCFWDIHAIVQHSELPSVSRDKGYYDRWRTADLRWVPGCVYLLIITFVYVVFAAPIHGFIRMFSEGHPIYTDGVIDTVLQDTNDFGPTLIIRYSPNWWGRSSE